MSDDVVVQVSDPHFGTERPEVVEVLVDWVRAQAPTLLVVSGDVTQRARATQFEAARAFVARLGVAATVVIPGNHDIPLFDVASRLLRPWSGFRRAFGPVLEPVHASPSLLVVAVNTTRRMRHVDGEVSAAQAERVARRLRAATPDQLRLVVTHQPVLTVRAQDAHDRLHGAEAAVRRWVEAGADLVLGGHIHLPYVAPLHGSIDGLARRAWAVQAGTAVSRRVRHEAGNSVNLIRWRARATPRRCVVERWDFDAAARAFVRVASDALELDAPPPAPVSEATA
ncbi:MAG: metallophosphoesterase [Burkholderiaceae bacterium]|jgi:3',5'-cyclic AMP phosphodiesterase CpdA|nr:metallophosphoesterase [Burkholderiales bacterium]MCZ8105137.1 metallophosphoesterase [Burkholderiales bacterium]MCZ8337582.1 metallophosphoesterase [Burkholderiaceae bacterium]